MPAGSRFSLFIWVLTTASVLGQRQETLVQETGNTSLEASAGYPDIGKVEASEFPELTTEVAVTEQVSNLTAYLRSLGVVLCHKTARVIHRMGYKQRACICQGRCGPLPTAPPRRREDLKYVMHDIDIAQIVICVVTLFLGVPGNLLVMITIAKFMKKSVTNMFIFNLALADLCFLGICASAKLHESAIYFMVDIGNVGCSLIHYSYILFFYISSFTLAAMAFERYIAICKPMKSHIISSYSRARKILATIWILAAIFALPQYFRMEYSYLYFACRRAQSPTPWFEMFFYATIFGAGFLVPFCVMLVSYVRTTWVLVSSIKEAKKLQGPSQGKTDDDPQGRLAVVKMLIIVVVVFAICWLPWGLNMFLGVLILQTTRSVAVYSNAAAYYYYSAIFLQLTYFNSCLNPILYACSSSQFRRGFRGCLSFCLRIKSPERDISMSSSAFKTGVSTISVTEGN